MTMLADLLVQQPLHILGVAVLLLLPWALIRPRRPFLLAPSCAWLLYAAWEWLVILLSPGANIRVDLLVIWPLVAIATLWPYLRLLAGVLKNR